MTKIFTIPAMGKYTDIFLKTMEKLDLEVMRPLEITSTTIQLGVKHSPDMICYPFKITLGNFIEAIEQGATDLVIYNSCGTCRFRQYHIMQDLILKDLGYDVKMHQIRPTSLLRDIKNLNPDNSYLKIWKVVRETWKIVKNMEENYHSEIEKDKINIAIVGEIYTILEPAMNANLIRKLQMHGAKVHTFINVRHLITDSSPLLKKKDDHFMKKAKSYLDGELGGHAVQNIRDTLYFTENNIDGIIHILPLSCMPETTIEPVLNKLCNESKTPLLRLSIDETNSEVNMDTRIETFIELIKRRKRNVEVIV